MRPRLKPINTFKVKSVNQGIIDVVFMQTRKDLQEKYQDSQYTHGAILFHKMYAKRLCRLRQMCVVSTLWVEVVSTLPFYFVKCDVFSF